MKLKRQINEKDLLKMLDIPTFRHMTKDKLASFVSALPDTDPEVAKKALEQFPDLSTAVTEIVGHYKGIISECLAGSDADTQLCLETCAAIASTIQSELKNPELTNEQRESLIDKSMQLVQQMREIDADGKRFRAHVAYAALFALCIAAATLASVLGGKTDFALPNLSQAAKRA